VEALQAGAAGVAAAVDRACGEHCGARAGRCAAHRIVPVTLGLSPQPRHRLEALAGGSDESDVRGVREGGAGGAHTPVAARSGPPLGGEVAEVEIVLGVLAAADADVVGDRLEEVALPLVDLAELVGREALKVPGPAEG
jgi:hypothetical protein